MDQTCRNMLVLSQKQLESNVGSDNLPLLTRGGGVEEFAEAGVVAPPGVSSPLFVGLKKFFHCFIRHSPLRCR